MAGPLSAASLSSEIARCNSVKGKIALVVGDANGLGTVIAGRLVDAGARVSLVEFGMHGRRIDEQRVAAAVREVEDTTGYLDAAIFEHSTACTSTRSAGSFETMSEDEWRRLFSGVDSARIVAKHALPLMKERSNGAIVNVAFTSGSEEVEDRLAQAIGSRAVSALTHALACEYGDENIRANAVCVGHDPSSAEPTPTYEDVADAVHFLLSDGARLVNGTSWAIDGQGTLHCLA